jgi:hypothetical protein
VRNKFLTFLPLLIGEEEIDEVVDSLRTGLITFLERLNPDPSGSRCIFSRCLRTAGLEGEG